MSGQRTWLGAAVSAVCLILAVRGVQWFEVWAQLLRADPSLIVAAGTLLVVLMAARSARWGELLMALRGGASLGQLFAALNIGYMANNLLPARAGDLIRAYIWGDWVGVSKAATLSTVAVERLLDLLCVFVFMLLLLPFVAMPDWALWPGLTTGATALALVALLVVVAGQKALVLRLSAWAARTLPLMSGLQLERLAASLLEGLAVLRQPRRGAAVTLWSVGIWAGQVIYAYAVIRSLGLPSPLLAAAAVTVFGSLGGAIPSAPGGIGVFHFVAVLTLGLFGVEREAALGAALLLHALSYLIVSAIGLFCAWRASLSWSGMHQLTLRERKRAN